MRRWRMGISLALLLGATASWAQEPQAADCILQGLASGSVQLEERDEGFDVVLSDQGEELARLEVEDPLNPAKATFTCKGDTVEVWSQAPFSATYITLRLRYAEGKLTLVKRGGGDPSAEACQNAEGKLKAGKVEQALDLLENLEYPGNYLEKDLLTKVVSTAHQDALKRFKAKAPLEGARLLQRALDLLDANGGDPLAPPQGTDDPVLVARNDLGFFLLEGGKAAEAEPILARVVAIAPERAVARLNYADCLWSLNRRDQALEEYGEYASRVPKKSWPKRVGERCPACKG